MKEDNVGSTELSQNNIELFSLSKGQKISLVGIFGLIALSLPFICLISLISAIVIGFIGEEFGYTGNPTTWLVIFLLWTIVWWSPGIRDFRINEDSMIIKVFLRKPKHIRKDEITHVTWKGSKIHFTGIKQKLTLNLSRFPERERIRVSHILIFKWLPYHLLPQPYRQNLDILNENHDYTKQVFNDPVTCSTKKWPIKLFRSIGIIALLLIVGLFSWFLLNENGTTKYIVTFIFVVTVVPIALLLIYASKSRQITTDSNGITYQSGKNVKHFNWDNIDAILWSINDQTIQIWLKNRKRYIPIRYKHMQSDDVDEFFRHVQAGSYLLDVPLEIRG